MLKNVDHFALAAIWIARSSVFVQNSMTFSCGRKPTVKPLLVISTKWNPSALFSWTGWNPSTGLFWYDGTLQQISCSAHKDEIKILIDSIWLFKFIHNVPVFGEIGVQFGDGINRLQTDFRLFIHMCGFDDSVIVRFRQFTSAAD